MMARPIPSGKGPGKLRIPEERKNALYEAMFNIFARDRAGQDMKACICGLALPHRPKLPALCKELGITPDEYLAELQGHGVFADCTWEQLLTTPTAHPQFACTPGYVLYHYLYELCKKKGIHQYRAFTI